VDFAPGARDDAAILDDVVPSFSPLRAVQEILSRSPSARTRSGTAHLQQGIENQLRQLESEVPRMSTNEFLDQKWILSGYEPLTDLYTVRIGDKESQILSEYVHARIMSGGKVSCDLLNVDFEQWDEATDTLVLLDRSKDTVCEVAATEIKDLLRKCSSDNTGDQSKGDFQYRANLVGLLDFVEAQALEDHPELHANEPLDPFQRENDADYAPLLNALVAFEHFSLNAVMAGRADSTPRSLREALTCAESDKWTEAVKEEIGKLLERNVFHFLDVSEIPPDKRALNVLWVFKKKINPYGEVTRYKARLVVDGSKQRPFEDYFQSYAPTVDYPTLRLLLSHAHARGWKIRTYDIVSAFTLAKPQVQTFVRIRGLQNVIDGFRSDQYAELKHNLYGDVAAPHSWFDEIQNRLMTLGFEPIVNHPCLFGRFPPNSLDKDGVRCLDAAQQLVLWVDDMVTSAACDEEFDKFEKGLLPDFEFTKNEDPKGTLGMEMERSSDGRHLKLHQTNYAKQVLKRFGFERCRKNKVPLNPTVKLSKADCPEVVDKKLQKEYQEKVGSLNYLAVLTRPDLSYAIGMLSRYLHAPGQRHLEQANYCLGYLAATVDYGITYTRDPSELYGIFTELNQIVGYSDADFAGCMDTVRSTSGNVILMNNGAISWMSKRQTTVAVSTSVAETLALAKTTASVKYLRQILADLNCKQKGATVIYVDNRTAILVNEGGDLLHETGKHVAVQNMLIKEAVDRGSVLLCYVKSAGQHADIFTKALTAPLFVYHRDVIMFRRESETSAELQANVCVEIRSASGKQSRLADAMVESFALMVAWKWRMVFCRMSVDRKHLVAVCCDRIRAFKRAEKESRVRWIGGI